MGDLAKYIAEVVEFVVAGVLVFFSLLLLGYVVVRPDLADLPADLPFLASLGGLLPVVGVALIYALGIIAEGMSRILFEHGLGELTAAKLATKATPAQKKALQEKVAAAESAASPKDRAKAGHKVEVAHYEGVREEWRMYVLAHSASLNAQVDGQLKRLRIERAAALSGGIGSIALLIDVALVGLREEMPVRAVLLVGLVLAAAVSARLWLVQKQLPDTAEASDPKLRKRQALQHDAAQGAALSASVLALAVLVSMVVEAGVETMGLRAALLVVTLVVTACAVALSLVRLKRYLGSIVRCYEALKATPPVGAAP